MRTHSLGWLTPAARRALLPLAARSPPILREGTRAHACLPACTRASLPACCLLCARDARLLSSWSFGGVVLRGPPLPNAAPGRLDRTSADMPSGCLRPRGLQGTARPPLTLLTHLSAPCPYMSLAQAKPWTDAPTSATDHLGPPAVQASHASASRPPCPACTGRQFDACRRVPPGGCLTWPPFLCSLSAYA